MHSIPASAAVRHQSERKFLLSLGFAITLALAFFLTFAKPVAAQSAAEKAAANEVIQLLRSAGKNPGSVSSVTTAVRSHFAIGTWVNALLGKQRKKLTAGQQSEFRKLLPAYLAKLYVNQFGGRKISDPKITRLKTVRGDVLVTAKLPRGNGGTIPVVWRLRSIEGKFRVIDYSVGGVSNLVLKRSEFGAKVKQSGGDSLNAFLRDFIAN